MNRSAWLLFFCAAIVQLGILAGIGFMIWSAIPVAQRETLPLLLGTQTWTLLTVGALALLAALALGIRFFFATYVTPLQGIAEQVKLIATSNPKHRLSSSGSASLASLVGSFNLLAERYQGLGEEVEARVREANAVIEEEKNTLAALMAKLTQGVLVCNPDGRILLYNQRALILLEGQARATGGGDWIGLGRSVFGVIEANLIRHALDNVQHQLREKKKEQGLLVPFIVPRPGGQMLSTHLVPIIDADGGLRGYILTLEDVTRRIGSESRRGTLLQALTEGQRSPIAGIRAAIETIFSFPDLDDAGRTQFLEVIRDEALKMSQHLDQIEQDYADELKFRWPLEDTLGSDFLATLERHILDARNLHLEVIAPVEPVWLRIDSYALSQCLMFLVDQLLQMCRAVDLRLTLEQRRSLAALQLEWNGAPLHMEALRTWSLRNVATDPGGAPIGLFEAIERHGGALWTDRLDTGRPCLRLVLPVSDTGGPIDGAANDDPGGHDFDFHLFEQPSRSEGAPTRPLAKLAYTVIDTETTGLNPTDGDEIIAIAAVRIVNGRILHREIFDSFVRPNRPISASSLEIHGITPDMLRGKPTIDQVLPRFQRFVEDTVIVGHNVAFDMRFLEIQGKPLGIAFAHLTLDTLILECLLNPNQEDKSLEGIASRLGINVTGRHTALGDALTTAEVFLALLPQLAERGICTVDDARALCAKSRYAEIRY